jgi:precorrin-6A/cobalt-precorrin-6A reductase
MTSPGAFSLHLLLLAGSGEGRAIASALAGRNGRRVTASLLHAPRAFGPLAVPTRLGGFGGAEAFRAFLEDHRIDAVLDATHPFAHRISARTAQICTEAGLPFAQVLRPAWVAGPGDAWQEVPDEAAACALIAPGERVFTTTGRATLEGFRGFPGDRLFVRQMQDRAAPADMPFARIVPGAGPFSAEAEHRTFRRLGIDRLVVKNSGGAPSRTKLDAARDLGLPVILLARPPQAVARPLQSVEAALDWVAAL